MGRRGGPRRARPGPPPARRPAQPAEEAAAGHWVLRPLTGAATDTTYRCPARGQEIRPATPHRGTWPAYARDSDLDPWDTESATDWRRHWHTACWRARGRRR